MQYVFIKTFIIEATISDLSVTPILSAVARLGGASAQVDGGTTRLRGELARLRAEAHVTPAARGPVPGDVTQIRGDLSDLRWQAETFGSAATGLQAALRGGGGYSSTGMAASAAPDALRLEVQAAANVAFRHVVAAEVNLDGLSDEFSNLQRRVPKL